jgi:hypothetical protein
MSGVRYSDYHDMLSPHTYDNICRSPGGSQATTRPHCHRCGGPTLQGQVPSNKGLRTMAALSTQQQDVVVVGGWGMQQCSKGPATHGGLPVVAPLSTNQVNSKGGTCHPSSSPHLSVTQVDLGAPPPPPPGVGTTLQWCPLSSRVGATITHIVLR